MDTRKTFRASPAVLVAMHSNCPSSQGPGLVMSSDPEDCKLQSRDQLLPWGSSERGKTPATAGQSSQCHGYL